MHEGDGDISVAPVTGTHRETSAGKGLFSWHRVQPAQGWGRAGGTWLCQGRLVVLAAPACPQGEAMAAVAVEGAVAVVADVVAGAGLCLALVYVWKRRGEGQSCAKGTVVMRYGQDRGWKGHGAGWGQLVKLGYERISNACTHAAVVLPLLVPEAVRWQMPPHFTNSCTATAPLCFGLAGTRAVSKTGHPRKQHPCSQGSTAAPGRGGQVSATGCRPRCLQVLTQALAGSGIKGTEARATMAGVCPGGVGAELAAVVQALGTLVDVWWWGREWHGVITHGKKAAQPQPATPHPSPPVLHIWLCSCGWDQG